MWKATGGTRWDLNGFDTQGRHGPYREVGRHMRHVLFGTAFASRPAATKDSCDGWSFRRKKHQFVGKVCPVNANPQELVLDLMAAFWAPNRLHAIHSTFCKLRPKPSEKHFLKYNDPPTPNLKKLVSFKCPVGSINLTHPKAAEAK